MEKDKTYIAIDLKSFYASAECVERGLDPLKTNLVVADPTRTEKTICLAVSPSLKAYGIPGRARLFEAVEKVREVNCERRYKADNHRFTGKSYFADELANDPNLEVGFIKAMPRMRMYMYYSTLVFNTYMKYVSPEDIHVYSVDEAFLDVTDYLKTYKMTARELAVKMIHDVLETTGITATAGIGTNMYLCKIAMDIVAKHITADKDGVRIAELDEMSYRKLLWDHTPITDFWRVGRGTATKLAKYGMFTMGDVAACSLGKTDAYHNEDLLYRLFGVNAELLIDHAWGWEPVEIKDIKSYRPSANSLSSGQVLKTPYTADKAELVTREMTDLLMLDLVKKKLVTNFISLTIGYDVENLLDPEKARIYHGEVMIDHYGREVPKYAHGTVRLDSYTSSSRVVSEEMVKLFRQIVNTKLTIRRITVSADVITEKKAEEKKKDSYEQLEFFVDYEGEREKKKEKEERSEKEHKLQKALIEIQDRYGKNAVIKGMNLLEGATAAERNSQIGGHKA